MKELIGRVEKDCQTLKDMLMDEVAEFITEAEYDNQHDCIYEIPRTYRVTKHGFHTEWCIMRIDKGTAYLGGMGEDFGEFQTCHLIDMGIEIFIELGNELI